MTEDGPYIDRRYEGKDIRHQYPPPVCFKCGNRIHMGHGPNNAYRSKQRGESTHYIFCNGGDDHLPFKVHMLG